MEKNQLLQVDNLSIAFISEGNENEVISNISFHLSANEILGIVGESGSGKSVSSLAIMGLLPNKISKVNSGTISFNGELLSEMDNKSLQPIRGKSISMIFQEPMSSLNPSMSCGKQVREILLQHTEMSKKEAFKETISLFEKVKLPDPSRAYNAFPHEISGGQKQRVMIAMAIACKPQVLIADEPTTALDVTVQKEIIALLKSLQKDTGMSIIFISHDLSLVSEIADRVVVMYKGKIIEEGFVRDVFLNPQELYTKALIKSRPSMESRLKILPTIDDFVTKKDRTEIISVSERNERHKNIYAKKPLLEIKNLEKEFFSKSGWFSKASSFKAVDRVSFKLYPGETLGLVGESGCGKSTLSNAILQLDKATAGTIIYKGQDITHLKASEIRQLRKEIQIIFQDPYASLNPRLTVGHAILEPMQVHGIGNSKEERTAKVLDLLEKVGLDQSYFNRYPHEFSGGQRQRIGIARTIAVEPQLIICDESVSALDISVQAQVLNLLNELKDNFGFTYIFISHDLAVVKYMSDQLVVMNKGQIEEMNDADRIYANPEKAYTKKLIHAIPKGL
ncbi:ABC transporter ATP-binding protein [Psychroserpens sp.]|uniref:ABC transporter ATP-binding protein n=1 Tax=Psychroserpens sp. TaxID=2020870 RepID=UPI001B19908A|nr:ABC transporter ATP-binding protein [Psychroserpens sp.]MBO6605450.1 ABC transporter ATP-binding protein [Psychroserpens sp.]MBO6630088.1 ABC transporter ATP-binding protein [Psychroserpens sp.]MBO6653741.1 ABC transporter ATP-binding protein [Psychroserpens sp.]MBO6682062.1 ABC transporter ATP-binding protein [Psychroserpens sp.]MBO6748824.1 ABC transporter ATP-binding protein [Psychroserpens sp.]